MGEPALVLVGQPNVGKSVLFGALTGRYATVSNYPGTTVELRRGALRAGGAGRRRAVPGPEAPPSGVPRVVIDTPGVHSLVPRSDDERVTRDVLLETDAPVVVQVADAKNLRRALVVASELADAGVPLVMALNMVDEASSRGLAVDAAALSAALGVPVVETIATRGVGLEALVARLPEACPASAGALRATHAPPIEAAIGEVESLLPEDQEGGRLRAIALLCGDLELAAALGLAPAALARVGALRRQVEAETGQPLGFAIGRRRLEAADGVVAAVVRRGARHTGSVVGERLAQWSSHPWLGWPILALVLYLVYLLVGVFGAGTLVDALEEQVFGAWLGPWLTGVVQTWVPFELARDFLVGDYGVFTMAVPYAFAIVLPIVGTFFVAFSILEDSGYLPRLAVMLDRAFRLMGLNGKAVLPMVLGLGCDTMATMTTRILESRKERLQVTLLLALGVPCSAQLGVVLGMIAGAGTAGMAIWGGVVVGVLLAVGFLAARVLPGQRSDFILELPPLRLPEAANVLAKTAAQVEWYLKEVIPIFVVGTAALFVLDKIGWLAGLEAALAPLVVGWLGLPREAAGALLIGFLRRDYGAAGLFELSRAGALEPVQVVVSLVVITLFMPCIATLMMIQREYGGKIAAAVGGFVFPFALLVGGLLNAALRAWPLAGLSGVQ
ncbi:MAG TPA: ferrous iron transport protein B [Chloroflexota bacterium]|nr:ferrous iron transport protein B [Chloroflexota bacterium]